VEPVPPVPLASGPGSDGTSGNPGGSVFQLKYNKAKHGNDVSLQLWRSAFGLFDSQLASATVNMVPALMHPDVAVERWFPLFTTDSSTRSGLAPAGKILLRLQFRSEETVATSTAAGSIPLSTPWRSPVDIVQQTVEKSLVGSAGPGGSGTHAGTPLVAAGAAISGFLQKTNEMLLDITSEDTAPVSTPTPAPVAQLEGAMPVATTPVSFVGSPTSSSESAPVSSGWRRVGTVTLSPSSVKTSPVNSLTQPVIAEVTPYFTPSKAAAAITGTDATPPSALRGVKLHTTSPAASPAHDLAPAPTAVMTAHAEAPVGSEPEPEVDPSLTLSRHSASHAAMLDELGAMGFAPEVCELAMQQGFHTLEEKAEWILGRDTGIPTEDCAGPSGVMLPADWNVCADDGSSCESSVSEASSSGSEASSSSSEANSSSSEASSSSSEASSSSSEASSSSSEDSLEVSDCESDYTEETAITADAAADHVEVDADEGEVGSTGASPAVTLFPEPEVQTPKPAPGPLSEPTLVQKPELSESAPPLQSEPKPQVPTLLPPTDPVLVPAKPMSDWFSDFIQSIVGPDAPAQEPTRESSNSFHDKARIPHISVSTVRTLTPVPDLQPGSPDRSATVPTTPPASPKASPPASPSAAAPPLPDIPDVGPVLNLNPSRQSYVGTVTIHIASAQKANALDAGEGNYYILVELVEGNPGYHAQTATGAAAAGGEKGKSGLVANEPSPDRYGRGSTSFRSSASPGGGRAPYVADATRDYAARITGDSDSDTEGNDTEGLALAAVEGPPTDDPTKPFVLRRYDYFKTHVVRGSSTPIFNRTFCFNVPHYKYRIKFTMIDSTDERVLGETHLSVYSIMQRDADRYFETHADLFAATVGAPTTASASSAIRTQEHDFPLSSDSANACSSANSVGDTSAPASGASLIPTYVGFVRAGVSFKQHSDILFTSGEPMCTPPPPQEAFSIERMGVHVARFQAALAVFSDLQTEYNYLVSWRDPWLTSMLFVLFIYTTLFIDAEYALCCPVFVLVVLMTWSLLQRRGGEFTRRWVERSKGAKSEDFGVGLGTVPVALPPLTKQFPYAVLRIAVTGQSNFPDSATATAYYVKLSYLHTANAFPNPTESDPAVADAEATAAKSRDSFIACAVLPNTNASASAANSFLNGSLRASADEIGKLVRASLRLFSDEKRRDGILHNTADPWPRRFPPVELRRRDSKHATPRVVPGETPVATRTRDQKRAQGPKDADHVDVAYIYPLIHPPPSPLLSADNDSFIAIAHGILSSIVNLLDDPESKSELLDEIKLYLAALAPLLVCNNTTSITVKWKAGRSFLKYLGWLLHPGAVRLAIYKDAPPRSTSASGAATSLSVSAFVDTSVGYVDIPVRDMAVSMMCACIREQQAAYIRERSEEEEMRAQAGILGAWLRSPRNCRTKTSSGDHKGSPSAADHAEESGEDVPVKGANEHEQAATATDFETQQWYEVAGIADDYAGLDVPHVRVRMALEIPTAESAAASPPPSEPSDGDGAVGASESPAKGIKVAALTAASEKICSVGYRRNFDEMRQTVEFLQADTSGEGGVGAISTLWNLRTNVAWIQNIVDATMDMIESYKNLLNWTIPSKTVYIYTALLCVWLLTCFVPGRFLLLLLGVYEFLYAFFPEPKVFPWSIRIGNLQHSIPNDDDLDDIYRTDQKRFSIARERRIQAMHRHCKLNFALDCLWEGVVHMKGGGVRSGHAHAHTYAPPTPGEHARPGRQALSADWSPVYLVVQGHRLVWWHHDGEIDKAKVRILSLFCSGSCIHYFVFLFACFPSGVYWPVVAVQHVRHHATLAG